MKLVGFAIVLGALLGVSSASAAPSLQWWKRPHDKYQCTRYAPGAPSENLVVFAPPGKPMIFTIGARAGRAKVSYRAEGLPAGATVDAKSGRFAWKIPATATGASKITLIAETASEKIATSFELKLADPDHVAAWRSGMGSMEKDCDNYLVDHEFKDVDGDGHKDLIYTTDVLGDDSAADSSKVFVRRRVGTKFDTIERHVGNGSMEIIQTPDGKTAIAMSNSCCCMARLAIYRVTPKGVDELASVGADDCSGNTTPAGPLSLETDAKNRTNRIVSVHGDTWKWSNGTFVAE